MAGEVIADREWPAGQGKLPGKLDTIISADLISGQAGEVAVSRSFAGLAPWCGLSGA